MRNILCCREKPEFRSGIFCSLTICGRIAAQIYQAVRESPARDAVDWSRVNFWWGDERFLPAGDAERNETQARAAFLDVVGADAGRVRACQGVLRS